MCLYKVTSVKKENFPKDEYKIGWKVVHINKNNQTFSSYYNKTLPLNTWLKCNKDININHCTPYPCGFHIFETREAARCWKQCGYNAKKINQEHVVKVKYRCVVARGIQVEHPCLVAKEMYVEYPSKKTDK